MDILGLFKESVGVLSTVVIAIFGALSYLIYYRPREPDFFSTPLYPLGEEEGYGFDLVIINPDRRPIVILSIEEEVKGLEFKSEVFEYEKAQHPNLPAIYLLPRIPEVRPERVYISTFPWVVASNSFAIWARKSDRELEEIKITVEYHMYRVLRKVKKRKELIIKANNRAMGKIGCDPKGSN